LRIKTQQINPVPNSVLQETGNVLTGAEGLKSGLKAEGFFEVSGHAAGVEAENGFE
jgi:hypothetical protein